MNFRQLEDWSSVESIVITSTDLLEFGNRLAIKKMLNSELVKPFKFFYSPKEMSSVQIVKRKL